MMSKEIINKTPVGEEAFYFVIYFTSIRQIFIFTSSFKFTGNFLCGVSPVCGGWWWWWRAGGTRGSGSGASSPPPNYTGQDRVKTSLYIAILFEPQIRM